jgi:hypothetical protein
MRWLVGDDCSLWTAHVSSPNNQILAYREVNRLDSLFMPGWCVWLMDLQFVADNLLFVSFSFLSPSIFTFSLPSFQSKPSTCNFLHIWSFFITICIIWNNLYIFFQFHSLLIFFVCQIWSLLFFHLR